MRPPRRAAPPAARPRARPDALRRLLRAPAPDLPALARKTELTIDDQASELTGTEPCLATLKADARRFALA